MSGQQYVYRTSCGLSRALAKYSRGGAGGGTWAATSPWTADRRCLRRGRGEGSGQRAGRQHEAKRCPGFRSAADVQPRAVQAAPGTSGNRRLGLSGMGDDPRHDRGEVGALGEDRRTLDHLATGEVRTRQARHQSTNRIIVHCAHTSQYGRMGLVLASQCSRVSLRCWGPLRPEPHTTCLEDQPCLTLARTRPLMCVCGSSSIVHKFSIVAATLPPRGGKPEVSSDRDDRAGDPSVHRRLGGPRGPGRLL